LSALRLKGERDQDLAKFSNDWLSQNSKLTITNPTQAYVKFNSVFATYTQNSPLYAPSANKLREQFNALGSTSQKGESKPNARNATDSGGLTKPK
jgi:P pilus assembly chaperone PapD